MDEREIIYLFRVAEKGAGINHKYRERAKTFRRLQGYKPSKKLFMPEIFAPGKPLINIEITLGNALSGKLLNNQPLCRNAVVFDFHHQQINPAGHLIQWQVQGIQTLLDSECLLHDHPA